MKNNYSPIYEEQTKIRPNIRKQYGSRLASSGTYNGLFSYVPQVNPRILLEYDRVRREEPTIRQGIEIFKYFVLGSIGKYIHDDPAKQKFIRENLNALPGGYKAHLGKLFQTMMWAGFACAEQINVVKGSKVYISDIAHYHPVSIFFKLDQKGRLIEGAQSAPTLPSLFPSIGTDLIAKSGIYQLGSGVGHGMQQLPMRKIILCTHDPDLKNGPMGTSIIEGGAYRNHVLKQAFQDMEATAFDRYGTPLIYMQVPTGTTDIKEIGDDGQPYYLSTFEAAKRSIEDFHSSKALVFSYGAEERKIEIKSLTTGNNFANSFDLAKKYCDAEMLLSINVPSVLIKNDGGSILSGSGAAEKQMELFANIIQGLIPELLNPFMRTVVGSLLLMNYGDSPTEYIGEFETTELNPKDILLSVSTMEKATALGYMNPENVTDWKEFRRVAGLPEREPTKEDLAYAAKVKKALIAAGETPPKPTAPAKPANISPKQTGASSVGAET